MKERLGGQGRGGGVGERRWESGLSRTLILSLPGGAGSQNVIILITGTQEMWETPIRAIVPTSRAGRLQIRSTLWPSCLSGTYFALGILNATQFLASESQPPYSAKPALRE